MTCPSSPDGVLSVSETSDFLPDELLFRWKAGTPCHQCELKLDEDRAWNVLSQTASGEDIGRFVCPIIGLDAEY